MQRREGKMNIKKVIILGLDALVPNLTERFINEGVLPNFKKLANNGIFTRVRPVIPAQTPANWQTIVTGATPGTHSVVVWGTHRENEEVFKTFGNAAFTSGICEAEYLWEVLSEYKKKSIILNYPGYPPTSKNVTFFDFIQHPTHSLIDIAEPTVYHNIPGVHTKDPVYISPAKDWKNLPISKKSPFEFKIEIIPTDIGVEKITYYGLIYAKSSGYDTLIICKGKDYKEKITEIKKGEWSGWINEKFKITGSKKTKVGSFYFKLIELTEDGKYLKLYRTDVFPSDGSLCTDRNLGEKIMRKIGPYINSAQTCHLFENGILDWETFDEVMKKEGEWWSEFARISMSEKDATFFVCHWHNLDSIGHKFIFRIDPESPFYNKEEAGKYWEIVRNCYKAADRFVGEFLKKFDEEETLFIVVSDHGMPANKKAVSLVNFFLQKGLLVKNQKGDGIDWSKSKIYIDQNHIWINLKGREKNGIVDIKEYKKLKEEIITSMRDLKDPDTGKHVFAFVLSKEDAPVVGLWGKYIGDVVFCYSGGYRWSREEVLKMGETRIIFPCDGGNHGPMIPTYETDVCSVMGTLFISGPGLRKGVKIPKEEQFKYCTTDIVPTICKILNIRVPFQNEGRVIHEFLKEAKIKNLKRNLKPLKREIRIREKQVVKLKGDVTDEL
jgi:predicted AlkP superfamily phosphohydrolase/phosphomutase